MTNIKKPLPFSYYYTLTLLLTASGIAVTIFLSLSHYWNYRDIEYASFCAISKELNCDTVSQSTWSILLNIPVAIWGFLGYLLYALILARAYQTSTGAFSLWPVLQLLGFLYSLLAIIFGYISSKIIQSYCLMCVLSYGISFSLFLLPVMVRKRYGNEKFFPSLLRTLSFFRIDPFLKISLTFFCLLLIGIKTLLPPYWQFEYHPVPSTLTTGMTEMGNPWIGAANPIITIEEFTDYQCFQCGKLHSYLRYLVGKHPDKIRLVHHHYPLDHTFNPILLKEPFHTGSGPMALLAIYATEKGKFWTMNDELYQFSRSEHHGELNLEKLSEKLALPVNELQSALITQHYHIQLARDIQKGLQLGITGTPAYLVDGQIYQGILPKEVLKKLAQ
jgi:uncharacterized membrane protein/predicted DsbA family dithiol-disulfide isomerase